MGTFITFRGVDALSKGLRDRATLSAVKQVVKLNGAELQQNAQRNSPVDTGTLKRSIDLRLTDDGLTATVEAHTNYAGYVEYGTRYMYPRLYLGRAYNAQIPQFLSDLNRLGFRR